MAPDISPLGRRVGQRIRKARLERDLTQEDVAFKVGISASYLGQLERGGRGLTLEKLVKIARALKVDPSELTKGI